MIDPLTAALTALESDRYGALLFALIAGTLTSIGPCVAPRYLALAAIIDGQRPVVPVASFVTGVIVAYVALGLGVAFATTVIAHVSSIYMLLAGALIVFGIFTLTREHAACADACHAKRWSGPFTLGATSGLVLSPCCTPMVIGVGALTTLDRNPILGAASLAAFAVGHAAPLVAAGACGAAFSDRIGRIASGSVPATVTGTLTIALGCYYGLLA